MGVAIKSVIVGKDDDDEEEEENVEISEEHQEREISRSIKQINNFL
jgi:hypothetical protein